MNGLNRCNCQTNESPRVFNRRDEIEIVCPGCHRRAAGPTNASAAADWNGQQGKPLGEGYTIVTV